MAVFHIWVSTYGLGGCRPVGHSGGLIAEGNGIFAVIWAWLVGGVGYTPGCMAGTVSPVSSPSGTESLSIGLSTGFCLLGHFRGGAGLLLWLDGQFCGCFHGWLVIIRDCVCKGGVDLGRWLHLPWHGGPILVMFEAGCVWLSRHSQRRTRWEASPSFALVSILRGWWWWVVSKYGPNRVGTHLKGPMAVLLVLVGHSEGARQAGRECRGWCRWWRRGKQI